MNGPRPRGRTRWPLLGTLALLLALLGLTTVLERAAPAAPRALPAVAGLPEPVLDVPVACTRADDAAVVAALAAELRPEGRITTAIVIACPRLFDGRDVVFVGEVVGDVLRRRGGAWVQVNDDAYALDLGPFGAHRERRGSSAGLAVWLPDGFHESLGPPGRAGRRGDVLRVEGVLRRSDPADGGGLTVRATAVEVLAPAARATVPFDRTLALAAAASAVAATLAALHARRRRTDA